MNEKVKACRICLNTDVKMFYINNEMEYYLSLLSNDASFKPFPKYICYECAALLVKFNKFRKKYILAQSILSNMLQEYDEITEQYIKEINLSIFVLQSRLSHKKLPAIFLSNKNIKETVHEETTYGDEDNTPDVEIDSDVEEYEPGDEVKADDAGNKSETEEEQLDDDTPYAFVVIAKPTEDKTDSQLEVTEVVQYLKRGQTRKRGAPPSKTAEQTKKPKRTKETSKVADNNNDLSKYFTIIKLSMEEQLEEFNKRKQSTKYLNRPFKCNLCYKGFINTHAWKQHLLKHDPSPGDIECPICKIRFKKKCTLRHSKTHEMKYICKSCPQIFTCEGPARLHQECHDGVTYKCKHCDNVYKNKTTYLSHLRIKHPSDFICNLCGYTFISKYGLVLHKTRMHKNTPADVQYFKRGEIRKRGAPPKRTSKGLDNDNDLSKYFTIIKLSMKEQLEEFNKRKQSTNYLNTPFKCNLCYRGFINTHAWKHHLLKHDPSAGNIECPLCKIRCKRIWALNWHSKINHEMKYICKSCPQIFTSVGPARLHQECHDGVTYKCKHCDNVYKYKSTYLSHLRLKHPSDIFCNWCGYTFVSKYGLSLHKKRMHNNVIENEGGDGETEPGPYCKECDIKFVSVEAWNRHMVISDKHKQTVHFDNLCHVCGKTFMSLEELRVHNKEVHVPKRTNKTWPAKCEHCAEVIPNAKQNWYHYRKLHPNEIYTHIRNYNYICDICGKRFPSNSALVYHKRTHSEEREFKCSTCGKAFHNRANLQTHETQTHSELRPFPCALCTKAFKSQTALSVHSRIHTGEKPYTCELCGKSFSQSSIRNLHVRTVHMKQPTPPRARRRVTPDIDTDTDTDADSDANTDDDGDTWNS